jgi:phosphoesterase RecJ-like protein
MADPYQQLINGLSRCKRILVTTHVRPDGDALGSVAAMALGLRKKGIRADALLLSPLPAKHAFVFAEAAIPFYEMQEGAAPPQKIASDDASPAAACRIPFAAFRLDDYDALLVVDTGTWSQLPGVRELLGNWTRPKLVLDHHLTQEDWADARLVVTEAAAAGEIVAELLSIWEVPLDRQIATALYVALVSDTGWFQYSNTRPYTLRLAATLMEAGVDTDALYQHLYQNERAERIALQTRAMDSLQLACDNRLAVLQIGKSDFEQTRAAVADTQNVINIPLEIRTVQVSMLFVESPEPGPVRVSLRSKGQVDVARFAEGFGGGGHARAAGLKVPGTLQEVRRQVVERMRQTLGGA